MENSSKNRDSEPIKNVGEKKKALFKMKSREELPEWIKNLSIVDKPIPDFDSKAEYVKHLEEK